MTPTLRTAILDALMERWRERMVQDWTTAERDYASSCLDMILPVAEQMIREAALKEAADVARAFAAAVPSEEDQGCWFSLGEVTAANVIKSCILALGESK